MSDLGPQVYVSIPSLSVQEESSFNATLNFRKDGVDSTPAAGTVKYRLDCLTTGNILLDWTTTAAPTQPMDIAITSSYNDIKQQSNRREKKQITVVYNKDSTDEIRAATTYYVNNLVGTP